jgi:RNA polymerase sigma-70 factor (ECF subfamily)
VVDDGDERAFRALYDRHTPRLLGLALQLTAGTDRATAEDIVHEAWARAVPRLATFEWRAELSTWLAGFVVNTAREARRHPDAAAAVLDEDRLQPVAGASQIEGELDARLDVERALAALPEGRRTVLILHDLRGYRHAEIAELLGVSVGTSKRQLHDARLDLARRLTQEEKYA